jgi:uncharacterized membrane protein YedE/YeeE
MKKVIATGFGVAFGFLISWGQFTDPDRIREMLTFQDLYMFLMMGTAIGVAFVGARLVRGRRTLLGNGVVAWVTEKPERRHITGAAVFGLGWALSDACPGPIAAQPALGIGWSVFTMAGVFLGVWVFLVRSPQPAVRRSPQRAERAVAVSAASPE